jgi:hypothetical protein
MMSELTIRYTPLQLLSVHYHSQSCADLLGLGTPHNIDENVQVRTRDPTHVTYPERKGPGQLSYCLSSY